MSKGSDARPLSVPFDEYAEKRKAIFGERVRVQWVPPPLPQEAVSAPPHGPQDEKP